MSLHTIPNRFYVVRIKSTCLTLTSKTLLQFPPSTYLNDLTPFCFLSIALIVSAPWPFSSSHVLRSFPSQAFALAVPSAWHTFYLVSPWLVLVYHSRFNCLNLFHLTSPHLHFLQKINPVLNSELLVYYVLFHQNISSTKCYIKLAPVLSGVVFSEQGTWLCGRHL